MKTKTKYYCDVLKPSNIMNIGVSGRKIFGDNNNSANFKTWEDELPHGDWSIFKVYPHAVKLVCVTKPRNLVLAWHSNLWGFCPQGNSDAPAVDNCPVCKNNRDRKNPDKKYWWERYRYLRTK